MTAVGALALVAALSGLAWSVWSRRPAPGDSADASAVSEVGQPAPAPPPVSGALPAPEAAPTEAPGQSAVSTQAGTGAQTSASQLTQPAPPAGAQQGSSASTRRPTGSAASPPAAPATPLSGPRAPVAPSVPPPARGELAKSTPPSGGAVAGTLIFHNVRLVRPGSPELDVELHFEPSRLLIMDRAGERILRGVPYSLVTAAEYLETRRRVFVKTTRHFLVLRGAQGETARLRLERDSAGEVVTSFEQRWGRPVTRTAPVQDEERP